MYKNMVYYSKTGELTQKLHYYLLERKSNSMIFKATNLIKQEMDRRELKYAVDEYDDESIISAGFGVNNGPNVDVKFISHDDKNTVAIRLYALIHKVADEKVDKMIKAVNECNCKYRYVRFTLDEDHDVNVEYDIPLEASDSTVGAEACEIFIRMMAIVDEAYPTFMSVMWG